MDGWTEYAMAAGGGGDKRNNRLDKGKMKQVLGGLLAKWNKKHPREEEKNCDFVIGQRSSSEQMLKWMEQERQMSNSSVLQRTCTGFFFY